MTFGRKLDIPSKSERLHGSNDHPAHVKLPPLKSMPCRIRKGVMIVVPAFSKPQNAAYRIIGGVITRFVGSVPEDVAN